MSHHHHEHHHEHEHEQKQGQEIPKTRNAVHIYQIENLDCANCAAKIEAKISALWQVEYASLTFATRQLRVAYDTEEDLLPLFLDICQSVEPDVTLTLSEGRPVSQPVQSEKEGGLSESAKDILCIVSGAVFMLGGILVEKPFPLISFLLLAASYLVLGFEIIIAAVKNLFRGNLFDENFLMSVATIAAFCIRDYPEAAGIMLFYRIGEWFEHKAVARSRSQIMDALDLRPETVLLLKGDETQTVPAETAVPGDVLLVRPGDRIPLDGVIVKGESRLDTSPVTGEPVPKAIKTGDSVISGCMNLSGVLQLRVEKKLEESMVSKILDSVENAAAGKPKIDRFITRFSRIYTPFVVLSAIGTAIIPSLITGNWYYWIYTAITFLVISCPCALVLSVPLAFFSGIGAGSRQGILFKGGLSIEALKNVKAVVMDKTGTITKGNFAVQECVLLSEKISETQLFSLAAACEQSSTHPIAVSILEAAAQRGITPASAENIKEISGHGIQAVIQNHEVLCGNQKLMEMYHVAGLEEYRSASAKTEVLIAVNKTLAGAILIADTLKEDAKEAISALKEKKIYTVMLTGDLQNSAESVAAEIGIDKVYAKLLPGEKLNRLQEIRSEKGAVMFVGDGINDAPVLAGADVGAAMGSGADAAIEAADVVFMNSSVTAIPESIRLARTTGRIAIQNVVFALIVKALVMILGLFGYASMWMAVIADSGVAMLCVLNSIRILYRKKK